jgi:DmsE family decaheme c-type cytochrome
MKSICTVVLRLAAMLWAVSLGVSSPASAQLATNGPFKLGPADTVLRGDAKCTGCHEDSDTPPPTMLGERPWILSIGKTKHGTVADGRTPTCSTCHGESAAHMKGSPDGKRPSPDRVYKKTTPAEVRNEACASCHKGGTHMFWTGSVHETRGTACTSCHDIHNNGHDKVRDKKTQAEVCYSCHKEQRAQMNRPSHHPVPEGKMSCSNCHAPHGSAAPKLLRKDSVNETCYECHMEKRGPFVHNHQPVTEDCSICHNPHGATAQTLLKQRLPLLCQNCHNAASHRTQAMQQLPGRSTSSGAIGSMARGCLNCHTNIHGSNSTTSSSSGGRFRQ